jgi:hypothetical protein
MLKRATTSLVCLTLFILLPLSLQAQTTPHDASNDVVCTDCHVITTQGGILHINVARGEEQETMCKNCHSAGGKAASMSSVGNHIVDGGNTILDCGSCHNPHTPEISVDAHTGNVAANLKLIRGQIRNVESALDTTVFQQDPEHFAFADGNEPWNGICQTCHTQNHYHTNDDSADHSHFIDTPCTGCHLHEEGFMPSGGTCGSCHGIYPDGTSFPNTAGSHATHFDAVYGPYIQGSYCQDCHPPFDEEKHMNGSIDFISGVDSNGNDVIELEETDVCDSCHSSGGTYDGVNDLTIGAKGNWVEGVYADNALQTGKDKWCVGCHDNGDSSINEGSEINGVIAPNMAGDDIDYGYYKTGHGKHGNEQAITCLACHDPALTHVDGEARTYAAADDNYQAGYRLKLVDGEAPLEVPRPINVLTAEQFRLCFSCHDSTPFLNFDNTDTNFRSDVNDSCETLDPLLLSDRVNKHNFHLWGRGGFPWDSDWDGETRDSAQSCPACHNVHGPRLKDAPGITNAPAMIRTGELIGRESSLNLGYFTSECPDRILSPTNETLDSTGGVMKFYGPGSGTVTKNGVCAMCHNEYQRYWREAKDILSCGNCHGE